MDNLNENCQTITNSIHVLQLDNDRKGGNKMNKRTMVVLNGSKREEDRKSGLHSGEE